MIDEPKTPAARDDSDDEEPTYCHLCGDPLTGSDLFCAGCGQPVRRQEEAVEGEGTSS